MKDINFKEQALDYFLAPRDNKMTLAEILEMLEEAERLINSTDEWDGNMFKIDALSKDINLSKSFINMTILSLMESVRSLAKQYEHFYELGQLSKQIENDN